MTTQSTQSIEIAQQIAQNREYALIAQNSEYALIAQQIAQNKQSIEIAKIFIVVNNILRSIDSRSYTEAPDGLAQDLKDLGDFLYKTDNQFAYSFFCDNVSDLRRILSRLN